MKIFEEIGGENWWIGKDAKSVLYKALEESGEPDGSIELSELSDWQLDRLIFLETGERDASTESGCVERTFRQQRDIETDQGGEFPRLFSSTYY